MEEDTGVTPPALLKRVEIEPELRKYLEAYYYLVNSRGYNDSGRQPFLISEIESYLAISGITGSENQLTYLTLLQSMDRVALNYYHEKQERK